MKITRFVCLIPISPLLVMLVTLQFSPVVRANQSSPQGGGSIPVIFPLPPVTYDTGAAVSQSVAVADLNGDGKPDLVVVDEFTSGHASCWTGIVSVMLGNGDGTFQTAVTYNSGGYDPVSVVIGDVNGDGHPDLVVANECQYNSKCPSGGGVSVLLGNGDGTFQAAVGYSSGGEQASSVALGDFNGDGILDIVVANYVSSNVSVLLGNSDGTFQTAVSYGVVSYAASVAVGDFNGDGKLDIVASCEIVYGVSVLLGNGDGTFQTALNSPGGGDPLSVADLNGDGILDLAGDGAITDFNGDGILDLAGAVSVQLGNGDGTFQAPVTYENGDCPLGCTQFSSLGILLGNGDGTFGTALDYSSGGYLSFPYSVAVADVNGDGWPDVLVADTCSYLVGAKPKCAALSDGMVGVLLNNNGAPHTTISLVSSVNPVNLNQLVTYTATVSSQSGGVLNGNVTFLANDKVIGTTALTNNQATSEAIYTYPGGYQIIAAYQGTFQVVEGSQSAPLIEYIRGTSKTLLTTSGSPSLIGQSVTFTATIKSKYGTPPNGELVTFYDGPGAIGTGSTANGVAAFTTTALSVGKHKITATYAGDNYFESSTGKVTQVVKQ
jgi:hypothetical protein